MPLFATATWNRFRYTLYAPVYDLWVGRLHVFGRGRRRAIELAALRPGERVLIVAAGTGLDLPLLPRGVEVIATDITPAMVRRIERRARDLALPVRAVVMDAAHLDLPDASVDCVLLHLALAVVPDPVAAIREAARVLRPGGRLSIFDKFLADEARPSAARRVLDVVANVIATSVNRQLGPLIRAADLTLVARETTGMGGFFVAARAEKRAAGG